MYLKYCNILLLFSLLLYSCYCVICVYSLIATSSIILFSSFAILFSSFVLLCYSLLFLYSCSCFCCYCSYSSLYFSLQTFFNLFLFLCLLSLIDIFFAFFNILFSSTILISTLFCILNI